MLAKDLHVGGGSIRLVGVPTVVGDNGSALFSHKFNVGPCISGGSFEVDINGTTKSLFIDYNNISSFSGTTNATTTATGSLTIAGGVGIAKDTYIGGLCKVSGVETILNTTNATDTASGSLVVSGGMGVAKDMRVGGAIRITDTSDAVNTLTGALVVNGGLAVVKKIYAADLEVVGSGDKFITIKGGENNNIGINMMENGVLPFGASLHYTMTDGCILGLYQNSSTITPTLSVSGTNISTFNNTTNATNTLTGALICAGGMAIANNLHVGGTGNFTGITSISNTTNATDTNTGAMIIEGGLLVKKSLFVKGDRSISGLSLLLNTLDSTSIGSGSIIVSGGMGLAKNLFIGGTINSAGILTTSITTNATDTSTGSLICAGGQGIAKDLYVGGLSKFNGKTILGSTFSSNITPSEAAGRTTTLANNSLLGYNNSLIFNGIKLNNSEECTEDAYNFGKTWSVVSTSYGNVIRCSYDGKYVYAYSSNQIYRSVNYGVSFVATTYSTTSSDFIVSPDGSTILSISSSVGLYKSTDYGYSFTKIYSDVVNSFINLCATDDFNIIYLVKDAGMSKSIDGGISFSVLANAPTAGLYTTSCSSDGRVLVVGSNPYGLSVSTNSGSSFTNYFAGKFIISPVVSCNGSIIVCFNRTDGVLSISTNSGTNFFNSTTTDLLSGNSAGLAISQSGQRIIFSLDSYNSTSKGGLFYSNNYGYSFTRLYPENTNRFWSSCMSGDGKITYVSNISNGYIYRNIAEKNKILDTTNATDTSTGSLICAGGMGIAKNLYVGSGVVSTDASTISRGLICSGGVTSTWGTYGVELSNASGSYPIYQLIEGGSANTLTNIGPGVLSLYASGANKGIQSWNNTNIGLHLPTNISITTNATDSLTGSLICSGGVGIAKDLHVGGGSIRLVGMPTVVGDTGSALFSHKFGVGPCISGGSFEVDINGTTKSLFIDYNNISSFSGTTNATTTATGSLTIAGGVGIAKDTFIGGLCKVSGVETILNTTDATNTSTGALICSGGLSVAKKICTTDLEVIGPADKFITVKGGISNNIGINMMEDSVQYYGAGLRYVNTDGLILGLYQNSSTITPTLTVSGTNISTFNNTTNATDTSTGSLICAGGVGIAKDLYCNNLYLPTSGGTASAMSYYETGTHNTTWYGIWASPQTGNITFTRIGDVVTLNIPSFVAAENTVGHILITTLLIERLRPSTDKYFPIILIDNSVIITGELIVPASGIVQIYATIGGNNFTGSGNGGIQYNTSISYKI